MGKKAIVQYMAFMSVVLTFVLAILTFMGLYGGDVSPVGNELKALLSFGLPFLIIANAIALLYWVIRLRIWMVIPIFTLTCCWNYISCIYQFDSRPADANQQEGLTIATYNVEAFRHDNNGYYANDVKNILANNGVDIVCFQEFNNTAGASGIKVVDMYKDLFPYKSEGIGGQVILSKYPIKQGEVIKFEFGGGTNSAQYADLEINGKTMRIYNVHFFTTGINSVLAGAKNAQNSERAKVVINSWQDKQRYRSSQANELSNYLSMADNNYPTILCGDFNDTPYTYTYNSIAKNLKDGFKTAGHGFMSTFNGVKGLLRIDYIFHSEDLTGLDYYSIHSDNSDHNPVFFKIKM